MSVHGAERQSGRPGHVLFIPSSYPSARRPGGGIFFQDQAVALARAGWRVGVAALEVHPWRAHARHAMRTWRRGPVRWADEHGVLVYRQEVPNPPLRRFRGRYLARAHRDLAAAYIERQGLPDVLHAHVFLWGGVAGAMVRQRFGIPLVVTEHSSAVLLGEVPGREQQALRLAAGAASATAAVSQALAHAVTGITGDQKTRVIPNVVDTTFFFPDQAATRRVPGRVFCAANLVPIKGIDIVILALARLLRLMPNATLRLAGDGPSRAGLERLVRQHGLEAAVTFLGHQSRSVVRDEMRMASVVAVPSRAETFGLVAAEAIACGAPVVSTNVGGLPEIVQPPFGRLVPAEDPDQLQRALLAVLTEASGASEQDGWRFVEHRFGSSRFVREVTALYAEAVATTDETRPGAGTSYR